MMSPSDVKDCVGMDMVNIAACETNVFHGSPIPKAYVVVLVKSIVKADVCLPFPNIQDDKPHIMLGDAIGTAVLCLAKLVKE